MDINLNQLVDKGPTDLVVNKIKNLPTGFETVPISSLAELVDWMEAGSQADG